MHHVVIGSMYKLPILLAEVGDAICQQLLPFRVSCAQHKIVDQLSQLPMGDVYVTRRKL